MVGRSLLFMVVALVTAGSQMANAEGARRLAGPNRPFAASDCASPAGWAEIMVPEAIIPDPRRGPLEWPYSIASSFSRPGGLYVGGSTGAYASSNCGSQWRPLALSESVDGYERHTRQAFITVDVLGTLYSWFAISPLAISDDDGATWRASTRDVMNRVGDDARYMSVTAVSAAGGGVVYAYSRHLREWRNPPSVGTWRSTDSGRSWALIDEVPILPLREARANYRVVAVHPQDANTLVALSMSGAPLVSSDGAATFRPIDPSRLPGLADDEAIFDVEFGSGGDRMWLRTSVQRVFETRDDGANWRQIPGPNSGEPIVFIAANPFAPDSFFALARSPGQQRIWIYREHAEITP